MILRRALVLATFAAAFLPPAAAQRFDPGSRYICPNHQESGLDCYLDAVTHLYTMCRHVKSIEIIEFGMAKAQEGVNGAKSEYCVDKQKINIARPYHAALREATGWREVVDSLRTLQQLWLDSMVNLKYRSDEQADAYEDRVNRIYDELSWRIESVRVGFSTAPDGALAPKLAKPQTPRTGKPVAKAN